MATPQSVNINCDPVFTTGGNTSNLNNSILVGSDQDLRWADIQNSLTFKSPNINIDLANLNAEKRLPIDTIVEKYGQHETKSEKITLQGVFSNKDIDVIRNKCNSGLGNLIRDLIKSKDEAEFNRITEILDSIDITWFE